MYRRIKSQLAELKVATPKLERLDNTESFENKFIDLVCVPRSDWGIEQVRTYRVIYTVSYGRPRWAIQLCKLAQKEALAIGDTRISKGHIDAVWGEYGAKRISDLVAEHKHQCKEIEELINAFRGAERLLRRDELIKWIKNHITNHLMPFIDGRQVRTPVEIAHFLYIKSDSSSHVARRPKVTNTISMRECRISSQAEPMTTSECPGKSTRAIGKRWI